MDWSYQPYTVDEAIYHGYVPSVLSNQSDETRAALEAALVYLNDVLNTTGLSESDIAQLHVERFVLGN